MPDAARPYGDLIPPVHLDATVDHPVVQQWVSVVLSGGAARLLLLGPSFSGKSHQAHGAVRALIDAGYPASDVAVYVDRVLADSYVPAMIDEGPPVIVIDHATWGVDLTWGVDRQRMGVDAPEAQAMMAAQEGSRADAVIRLSRRANASWIICASGIEQLTAMLGEEPVRVLTQVADTVVLEKRPRENDLDW